MEELDFSLYDKMDKSLSLEDFISKIGRSTYDSFSSKDKEYIKGHFDKRAKAAGKTESSGKTSILGQLAETQIVQTSGYSPKEMIQISDVYDEESIPTKIWDRILFQLNQEAELHNKINEGIGMHGELSKDFRSEIIDAYPDVVRLGYGFEQLGDFTKSMMEQSGKFNVISSDTIESVAATSRAFVGDFKGMGDVLNKFMNIGLGAKDTTEAIDKAGVSSLQLALNSKKTTEILIANIGKLNEYGFKNGTDGLNRMVQKSIEFRMNIEETFKIAEKVWSPEGAIDLAANLQVIGGAIGAFNDPLKLMYMATNNVEGLQDALIGAASGLATYNEEQGRFEVTGVNLRRAKAMADALGISMSELTKGAIASAERLQINSQMLAKGFNISEEDREFITNMTQIKGGKSVIEVSDKLKDALNIKDNFLDINSASEKQMGVLLNYRQDIVKNYQSAESIARDQLSLLTSIVRDTNYIVAQMSAGLSKVARTALSEAGFDQNQIATLIGTYYDMAAKGIIEPTMDGISKFITDAKDENSEIRKGLILPERQDKNYYENLSNAVTKKEVEKTTSTTETNSNVNVKISADGYFDIFASELRRQPQIWKEHIETNKSSYTVPGNQ